MGISGISGSAVVVFVDSAGLLALLAFSSRRSTARTRHPRCQRRRRCHRTIDVNEHDAPCVDTLLFLYSRVWPSKGEPDKVSAY
jgi:hypothetical protein